MAEIANFLELSVPEVAARLARAKDLLRCAEDSTAAHARSRNALPLRSPD